MGRNGGRRVVHLMQPCTNDGEHRRVPDMVRLVQAQEQLMDRAIFWSSAVDGSRAAGIFLGIDQQTGEQHIFLHAPTGATTCKYLHVEPWEGRVNIYTRVV